MVLHIFICIDCGGRSCGDNNRQGVVAGAWQLAPHRRALAAGYVLIMAGWHIEYHGRLKLGGGATIGPSYLPCGGPTTSYSILAVAAFRKHVPPEAHVDISR